MTETMDFFETLERWSELKEAIARLQGEERALRQGLFDGTFPDPHEGTNKFELEDGRVIKGVLKINRKVSDPEGVAALPKKERDVVFKTEYTLRTTPYKNLDDIQRKAIDRLITATAGLPTLTLVEAKPSPEEVAP